MKRKLRSQNILTRRDIEKIHATSMEILEKTGVEILHKEAIRIFEENGARVEKNRVYLSSDIIERMLDKVPTSFTLHARNSVNDVVIGDDTSVLAPGYGAPFVTDLDKGRRKSTFADYVNLTKLASVSEHLDVLGGVLVEPNDISDELRHARMFYAGAKYSDKCLMGSSMGAKKAHDCLEMARILFGEEEIIDDKAVVISLINTNSPLKYDYRMLGAMIEYAKHNQPLAITSGAMAGTTAPMSLAGTLVLENVEILTGIVLTQMLSPGAPVLYGPGASITDMKTAGMAIGSPEYAKLIGAGAQLARFYNLPCRASGALTDSNLTDTQAGYESMMTLMSGVNHGLNFIIQAAGILDGFMTMSYEKFIVDDEILGMITNYQKGIEVNETTIAKEVITEVGPGGHYLSTDHTLKHMRDFRNPMLSKRDSYKDKDDLISTSKRANKKWKNILTDYEEPYLDSIIEKRLVNYIEDL